jgi:WhiB family transcriptional regulator, redox-sensing transcriptional regulator
MVLSDEHRRQFWGVPAAGAWSKWALCRGMDPTMFVPVDPGATATAKAVCDACPVELECRNYGLRYDLVGVWGGWDEEDRRHWRLRSTNQRRNPVRNLRCQPAGIFEDHGLVGSLPRGGVKQVRS